MFDLGMTPSLPTGCDWGVRIWISRLLPCILAKLVLIDLTKKRTEKKTLLLAQLIQIQSKLTASMCVSLFDGKNDRRNSGGTLRQKFHLINIWHLIFDIWHMTFYIFHSTNGPMDQWINGPMDQWTNGPMDQWTNGPMDHWTNGTMDNVQLDQRTDGPVDHWTNGPMV